MRAAFKMLILSAAPGYGGAEQSVKTILSHLPGQCEMNVLAESGINIAALEACGHPRLTIHRIDTRDGAALARAAFTLMSV